MALLAIFACYMYFLCLIYIFYLSYIIHVLHLHEKNHRNEPVFIDKTIYTAGCWALQKITNKHKTSECSTYCNHLGPPNSCFQWSRGELLLATSPSFMAEDPRQERFGGLSEGTRPVLAARSGLKHRSFDSSICALDLCPPLSSLCFS